MTQYSYDAQLREEDGELFHYSDVSWTRKHVRAAEDLVRDLKAHGYLQDNDHVILDESAAAAVTLTFTAGAGGDLTVPAGTQVRNLDPDVAGNTHGAVVVSTDADLVVTAGNTGTVAATAEHPGEVYNVDPDTLVYLEDAAPTNFSAVTNAAAAGGLDHQLTRAAVYRVLELIMQDLMRNADDSFEHRRRMYRQAYRDELDRLVASGVRIDANADGEIGEAEKDLEHGFHRFRRA